MSDSLIVNIENHRSRERIKDLGEVFTPEQYVQQILNLFDTKVWSDENVVFFEPSAGHGNIVLPILEKRITTLNKKYIREKVDKATLHAIANALNSLWAIDICPINIELTRKRVLTLVLSHLKDENQSIKNAKMRNFLGHVLCTIIWQIHENEALSALSNESRAQSQASKTKLGNTWYKKNSHKPINFKLDWCEHFKKLEEQNVVPAIFLKALRMIDSSLTGNKVRGFEDFNFAKEALFNFSNEHENISTGVRSA